MKMFLNLLSLLTLTVVVTSCMASPEEKAQRRANAFDISGTYDVRTSSYTPMTLKIVNEGDFSNVYGVISRGDFSNEEKAAFARQNISLNSVEKFRTDFKFGLGQHNRWLEGGENISRDLGASSRVFITTSWYEGLTLDNATISYGVTGTMHKADMVLKGKVIMTIITTEIVNGQKTFATKENVELSF